MRVLCRHGHFAFYPRGASDIYRFAQSFDVELEREEDYFTFPTLKGAESYSLAGKPYLGIPALETFEGKPWDVMKENGLVYDVQLGIVVPKTTIVGIADITQKGFFYVCNVPLLQPGARTILGRQILSYSGEFREDKFYLRILEFGYE
jgi:hypothetical protein